MGVGLLTSEVCSIAIKFCPQFVPLTKCLAYTHDHLAVLTFPLPLVLDLPLGMRFHMWDQPTCSLPILAPFYSWSVVQSSCPGPGPSQGHLAPGIWAMVFQDDLTLLYSQHWPL